MTMSCIQRVFVQIGATRDGLDPYLDVSHERSMPAVLVETPAYLRLRRQLGRRPFDIEIPVARPADAEEVRCAIAASGLAVALLLPGFERYTASAYAVAALLGVPPRRGAAERFMPPDKADQRAMLAAGAPSVLQPAHVVVSLGAIGARVDPARIRFPAVVKPSNAGGGLGVFMVGGPAQLARAIEQIRGMTNYDGGSFERVLIEEHIEGVESSIQALSYLGRAILLTACEKIITREQTGVAGGLLGFREAAHIVVPRGRATEELEAFAQKCIDATGYRDGPFHVDLIQNARGMHFVEMGFRLSGGGIVGLVQKATGLRWAELSFLTHLDRLAPAFAAPSGKGCVGQATLASPAEMDAAARLRARGLHVEIERFQSPKHAFDESECAEAAGLASDRLRHVGFAGRVTVYTRNRDEARAHLRGCLAARIGA